MSRASEVSTGQRLPLKILVSLVVGVVGYLIAQLVDRTSTQQTILLSLGISFFVAGIAFVVQFLYDVEKQLDSMANAYQGHARTNEERINEGFKKINAATQLFGLVEASELNTDEMTQLVRNATQVKSSPPLVFEFAQAEITRLSEMLKTLSDGEEITYEGEDRDWLLGLTRVAAATIDATSLTTVDAGASFIDGGLWESDLGHRYMEAQQNAIRRGVRIRRIFILVDHSTEFLNDPKFQSVCRHHKEIGIAVKILDSSRIASIRHSTPFVDFIIFDSVLAYQTTPAGGPRTRPEIVDTRLITKQGTVQARIQRFQELWNEASEIP